MGQTGPLARFAGFGNLAAALCGFYNLVGWPDRTPSGPYSAYTDYIAPRFGLAAVMAALIHRKRTGEGQYIDQAQAESALQFLTLPILDTVASGRKYSPIGNDDLQHAPHGVYPAGGQRRAKPASRPLGRDRLPHRRAMARIVVRHGPAATR